ncbi:MAG: hypothetical protein FWD17_04295 [Polyangiaceae bacterium]|nr:hypothetical protein [Polyangiaceae bacterium]
MNDEHGENAVGAVAGQPAPPSLELPDPPELDPLLPLDEPLVVLVDTGVVELGCVEPS